MSIAVHKIAFFEAMRGIVPDNELPAAFDRFMHELSESASGQRVYIGKRGGELTEHERAKAAQLFERGYSRRQVSVALQISRYQANKLAETRTDFGQQLI